MTLESRVVDGPLVTVTGTGGIGKSRLALSVARRLVPAFPDGVFYLDLASLDRVDTAVAELATLTDARMSPGDDPRRCSWRICAIDGPCWSSRPPTDRSASRRSSDGSSRTARPRDSSSPHGPPSTFGPSGSSPSNPSRSRRADEVSRKRLASPAVALFADRARAVSPAFELTEANVEAVAAIVRRLDGLPLAIELAAAATRLLSPGGILTRLERSLPLPGGATVDAPERQRTIRDTVAWSYMLLEPAERTMLARLSVFAGAFDLDGVMALSPPEADPASPIARRSHDPRRADRPQPRPADRPG